MKESMKDINGKGDFLIRFGQAHESFRLAEIEALARIAGVELEVVSYSPSVKKTSINSSSQTPFTHVRLPSVSSAKQIISRSILAQSVHELWGQGDSLSLLHDDVRKSSSHLFARYEQATFRFSVDSFQGSRTKKEQVDLINGFSFVGFEGPIRMKDPEETFTIFEEWEFDPYRTSSRQEGGKGKKSNAVINRSSSTEPKKLYLGRLISHSSRYLITQFDLKKRAYISTTSMDAELALVTANVSLAAPGKLFYDPFVGTGGFPLAAANFGALVFGSDIDGRALRGTAGWTGGTLKPEERCLRGNFEQYGLKGRLGDVWVADLANSPVRTGRGERWLDGIICDPPYGVREGLRILGHRNPPADPSPQVDENGVEKHKKPDFIPPKRPYSFHLMLHDILQFSFATLVDSGRLSFWMPTANDDDLEIPVPSHPGMHVVSVCTQPFNKWSRRLITYRRRSALEMEGETLRKDFEEYMAQMDEARRKERDVREGGGRQADELNPFRKAYFSTERRRIVEEARETMTPALGKLEFKYPDLAGTALESRGEEKSLYAEVLNYVNYVVLYYLYKIERVVVVMDGGRVAEDESPREDLAAKEDSSLAKLLAEERAVGSLKEK
ncbi:TRM11 catalytic subunit [Zalerion maritima]|uniref:tRNA (guanine(10)-N(2))-methyltransferase n=1 Tax=Zalerion maritima TaxID=339359 RepID=A0AAD5WS63_9PEZI|nr:TRM11 catalytic subunit [Zalerion maritima]